MLGWLRHPRWLVGLFLVLVGGINLISCTDFAPDADVRISGDSYHYLRMSLRTFEAVPNPFAFRLLTPWLVQQIAGVGVGLNTSWILVTFGATSLALYTFFLLLLDGFRLRWFTSVAFTLALAFTHFYTLFNYRFFWLVDPLNNLFMVVALSCLVARRTGWFLVVVTLGFVNKETVLLLLPLAPLLAWVRAGSLRDSKVWGSLLGVLGVSILYLLFRLWVQSRLGVESGYAMLTGVEGQGVLENIRFAVNMRKGAEQVLIYQTFHFMWAFFAYGLYRLFRQAGARSEVFLLGIYLLVACAFGRLFASDVERVYVMMAPLVLGVAALLFDNFQSESQRWWLGVLLFFYLALNMNWVMNEWTILVNGVALVLFVTVFGRDLDGEGVRLATPDGA